MFSLHTINDSPFLLLWYLFLGFLTIVVTAHVFFAFIEKLLKTHVNSLLKVKTESAQEQK